jgi:ABC-type antimicrobial peptide transport system permease subunit
MTLVAWAPQRPEAAMQALRSAVSAVDPERPLAAVGTMQELLSRSLSPSRLVTVLVVAFAAVALLLSLLGIYGVTAYAVGQRRREIGVRMALGADRRRVVGLVLSGGGRLVALGLVLGGGLSLVLGRTLVGLLYGVTPGDPITLAASAMVLALAAAGACWLPARRASRIDPVTALREG